MYRYEYMETQSPVHDFNEREPSKKFIKFSTIYCRKNCNQKHITAFSSCIISWITLHDGNLSHLPCDWLSFSLVHRSNNPQDSQSTVLLVY